MRASPLISIASSWPTWYTSSRACHFGTALARMSLGAVIAFIVRAVTPRRSLCCRAMPKSPSFRRRPSQTKTFSGVRSRCSVCPRCSLPRTSRMPAISRRAVVSRQPLPLGRNALRSPWLAYSRTRQYRIARPRASAERLVDGDRPGMPIEQLSDVGLAQPPVDPAADLDAHRRGHRRRLCQPPGQVDLAEPALTEQRFVRCGSADRVSGLTMASPG